MRYQRVLGVLFASSCIAANARGASPYRYDDDLSTYIGSAPKGGLYDDLKYIPLDGNSYDYLSLGADFRERIETSNVQLLGFRYRENDTYDLHRLLIYADLHLDRFRIFVQVGNELETGREPSALPTDIDRGDLAQGFVDYQVPLSDRSTLMMRAGRFEMSFDEGALVSLRDGPNTRQTWEGVHGIYGSKGVQADFFAVRPVNVNPGWFDDNLTARESLWGLHLEFAPPAFAPVVLTAFYYGSTMPKVFFAPLPSSEHTNTVGVRARLASGGFDGSLGTIAQTGSFDERPVSAWSSHFDAGWTFFEVPWTPRIGIRADALSGGNDAHGVVHTFNALYPNYSFSTEATIESPSNLIQSGVTLDLKPIDTLSVQYKLEGLWRYSLQDAFYGVPTVPLAKPTGETSGRYSGSEQQLRTSWQLNRFFNLTAALVHFTPASFLRASHAVSENFGMAEFSVRL